MPNYLDDLITAHNGIGDTIVDAPDDGTPWLVHAAASGTPRMKTLSGVNRPATGGKYRGDLHIVGHGQVVDIGGCIWRWTNTASAHLFLHDFYIRNGTIQWYQADTGLWFCHQDFTQGDWGASALSTKHATAKLTAGSKVVQITGGTDRFASTDVYVPTGSGRGTADASHGFLRAHGGGNYHGQVSEGWHFGVITSFIDATHVQINQAPVTSGTFAIDWGPFPGANIRGPRVNQPNDATSVRNHFYGCDIEGGTVVEANKSTGLLILGCHELPPENDTTLDPPDVDVYHNDALTVFIRSTGITVQFSELEGRFIVQDNVSPYGAHTAILLENAWVHGPYVVLQLIHASPGTGIQGIARSARIWNESAAGKSSAVLFSGGTGPGAIQWDDSNDVIYGVAQSGNPPWHDWRALVADTQASWESVLYGIAVSQPAPDPPTITGLTPGDASVAVAWTDGSDHGSTITQYTITATPSGGGTVVTKVLNAPAGNTTVTGLVNGTAYTFTIKARNAGGYGTPSASAGPSTPTASSPPPNPNASAVYAGVLIALPPVQAPVGPKRYNGVGITFETFNTTKRAQDMAHFIRDDKAALWARLDYSPLDFISGSGSLLAELDLCLSSGCSHILLCLEGSSNTGFHWGNTSDRDFPTTADASAFAANFQAIATAARNHVGNTATLCYELSNEVTPLTAGGGMRGTDGLFRIGKYLYALGLIAPALKTGDSKSIVVTGCPLHYITRLAGEPGSNIFGSPAGTFRSWSTTDFYRDMLLNPGGILSLGTGSIGTPPLLQTITAFDGYSVHPYSFFYGPATTHAQNGNVPASGVLNENVVWCGIRELPYVYDALIAAGIPRSKAKLWATEQGTATAPDWKAGVAYPQNQVVSHPGVSRSNMAMWTATRAVTASDPAPGTAGAPWSAGVSGTWNKGSFDEVYPEDVDGQDWYDAMRLWFGDIPTQDGRYLGGPHAGADQMTAVQFRFTPADGPAGALTDWAYGWQTEAFHDKGSNGGANGSYRRWLGLAGLSDPRT